MKKDGSMEKIYKELREVRHLARRGVINAVTQAYYKRFLAELSPLQSEVMIQCYVEGFSYETCGQNMGYCERQIKRIVRRSIDSLIKGE